MNAKGKVSPLYKVEYYSLGFINFRYIFMGKIKKFGEYLVGAYLPNEM